MNIDIKSGTFEIKNGTIKEITKKAFTVKKIGDTLELSVDTNRTNNIRGIVQSGNGNIYIDDNRVNVIVSGKKLIVNGDIEQIKLNGKTIDITKEDISSKEESTLCTEYSIDNTTIKSITISGVFGVMCFDQSSFYFGDSLLLAISGEGLIMGENFACRKQIINITGNGSVELKKVTGDLLDASISGEGDVSAKSCNFKKIIKSITGNGKMVEL